MPITALQPESEILEPKALGFTWIHQGVTLDLKEFSWKGMEFEAEQKSRQVPPEN